MTTNLQRFKKEDLIKQITHLEKQIESLKEEIRVSSIQKQALQQNQDWAIPLLESSREMVFRYRDPAQPIQYVNAACSQWTGFQREELMKFSLKDYLDRIHPEDLPRVLEIQDSLHQVIKEAGNYQELEYRFLHRDGQYRWFSDRRTALFLPSGELDVYIGIVRDITACKALEILFHERNRRLESLIVLSHVIARCHTGEELCEALVTHLREQMPMDAFFLDAAYPNGSRFHSLGNYDTIQGQFQRVPEESNAPFWVSTPLENSLSRGKMPLLILRSERELQSVPEYYRKFGDKSRRSASLIYVPLVVHDQCIGVMSVQSYQIHAYSHEDMDFLNAIAILISPAIERLLLTYEIIEKSRESHEQEERLRAFFNAQPDIVAVLDEEGRYIEILSPDSRLRYGTAAEIVGKRIHDIFPKKDADWYVSVLRKTLDTGEPQLIEYSLQFGEDIFWLESRTALIPTLINQKRAVVWITRDISARKKAELALRNSEERYRTLFENSPISLWEEDLSEIKKRIDEILASGITDFRAYLDQYPEEILNFIPLLQILQVNRSTLALYEVESIQDIQSNLSRLFNEDTVPSLREELIAISDGKTHFAGEGISRTLRGKPLNVSIHWSVAPEHTEDYSKVLVSIVDISELKRVESALRRSQEELEKRVEERTTELQKAIENLRWEISERMRMERALIESEARYRAIVQDQTDPICRFVSDGSLTFVNDAFCRFFGKHPDELEKIPYYQLFSPKAQNQLMELVKTLNEENCCDNVEICCDSPNGQYRWLQWNIRAIHNTSHQLVEYQAVGRDITQRKLSEDELRRAEQIQRDFIANVSHEFKTPLTSIRGYAETLLSGRLKDESITRSFMNIIHDNAIQLATLTDDLMQLSLMDAGRLPMEKSAVPVYKLLDQTIKTVRPNLLAKQMDIVLNCSESIPPLYGNSDRLRQIVQNLLDNAIRYSPARSLITVSAAQVKDSIRIEVTDEGIGIPAEELNRIFERFYQVDPARSRKSDGSGLGLAIVKNLVEAHDGRIEVRSTVGKGSTFTLYLPYVKDTESQQ